VIRKVSEPQGLASDWAVGELLPLLDRAFPVSVGTVLEGFLRDRMGARSSHIYLADYDLMLLRLWHERDETVETSIQVEQSEPGRAFVSQLTTVAGSGDRVAVHLPISVRAERLGVLSVILPAHPSEAALDGLRQVAVMLGYIIITAGAYTDTIERARRARPLELPAEIQWAQLPVRAYTCETFTIAGQLVPAYEVGGDLFDYAVEPRELCVCVTDAMGHGLEASMLATLANGALRNARRGGLTLVEQVSFADRVLFAEHGGERFVTALSLAIDLGSGQVRAVNGGHPAPFIVSDERVTPVVLDPQLPLGMFEATNYVERSFRLRAGDRLVVVSDGVIEAPSHVDLEPYGDQRLAQALLATADVPAEETVRRLVGVIRDYQADELRDDATVLVLDWHR
jgi:serine phosphatase RsbU (regulator of sigma subunit)